MAKKQLDTRHVETRSITLGADHPITLLETVKGKTANHRNYLKLIDSRKVSFCLGPAGTGKTWMACGKAAKALVEGAIKKIILTRPLVTCGNKLGFLPGDATEKSEPYMLPLLDAFTDFLGEKTVRHLIETKVIMMFPMELMRGSNLRDSFIICDEAQNAEFSQLHMFLTRIARGSKVVITGDDKQADLLHNGQNPLAEIIRMLQPECHPEVGMIRLDHGDVMREGLVAWIDRRLQGLPDELEVFSIHCPNCESQCCFHDHDPMQLQCWSCEEFINCDDDGTLYTTALKSGVCTKTFQKSR